MGTEYPTGPVVGVGGVIVRDGRALLVRRGRDPRKGEWSLPGGAVELGEHLVDAVRREMHEETGLAVEVGPIVETFDRVHHDADGRVRWHYVIVDFLCAAPRGEPVAGTDADEVTWAAAGDLAAYEVNAHAAAVILKGLALAAGEGRAQLAFGAPSL